VSDSQRAVNRPVEGRLSHVVVDVSTVVGVDLWVVPERSWRVGARAVSRSPSYSRPASPAPIRSQRYTDDLCAMDDSTPIFGIVIHTQFRGIQAYRIDQPKFERIGRRRAAVARRVRSRPRTTAVIRPSYRGLERLACTRLSVAETPGTFERVPVPSASLNTTYQSSTRITTVAVKMQENDEVSRNEMIYFGCRKKYMVSIHT